ncbi:hypothetical protein APA_1242 [Pseudanabaena sp. lw0831]|uniref:transposase n=1 Tax=Pseudanabaena sp. lw0831 TaxID=1357935 RepID=UPI001915E4D0|nr:transposase [Pseudanabaena sp. lw0831]GBO53335.1 hypothetical protein APA_1242 [Pseudanabaena sp. lw0831]
MPYNPDIHHRRSIRLKGYDYSKAGAYFVTICINQRKTLLGEIGNGIMKPTPAGEMVQTVWNQIPLYYLNIELDAFVLMPNHIHGIVVLKSQSKESSMTLGKIIHRFKSYTTAKYRHGVNQGKWQAFVGRLWQRGYHERIIRSEKSCDYLRQYIENNPLSWELDTLHPHSILDNSPYAKENP